MIAIYGDAHTNRVGDILLPISVIIDNEIPKTQSFVYKNVVPLEAQINEVLKPLLDGVMQMAKEVVESSGISAPDVILLSGKSSMLPIVRQLFKEMFPGSDIQFPKINVPRAEALTPHPDDLKECVVLGACQLKQIHPVEGVLVRVANNSRFSATTSRLGILASGHFKEVFKAGVPIGEVGIKAPVKVTVQRQTHITFVENTGVSNEWLVNGQQNQNISVLKKFKLEHKILEWEQKHGRRISDEAIIDADIEMEVTSNLIVRLIARIPDIEEPFEFEAELN
jgi:hypothetical protein